ncbi:hypothetical protein BDZ91DRAFT_791710 [Kalaharituber pfeilii]|nr:hypothetical protein BDZ91DRAFT_791710 [Kalaharituber pfeilii]
MNSFHGGMANGPWRIIRSILAALLLLTTTVSAGAISTPTTNNPVPADLADTGSSGLDLHTPPPHTPLVQNSTCPLRPPTIPPSLSPSSPTRLSAGPTSTRPPPGNPSPSLSPPSSPSPPTPPSRTSPARSSPPQFRLKSPAPPFRARTATVLDGGGEMMRWGVPTRPKCMLCLRSDGVVEGKRVYDRFEVEMCEPHEDMVKKRVRERKERERERERGGERGQKVLG